MALLDTVKQALGIFYSETTKDAEIQTIINGAKAFLLGAGVPSSDLADNAETDLVKQMVIIYAKMAVNTDPTEMRLNPVIKQYLDRLLTWGTAVAEIVPYSDGKIAALYCANNKDLTITEGKTPLEVGFMDVEKEA